MFRSLLIVALSAGLLGAVSAHAATMVTAYNFNFSGSSAVTGAAGNSLVFTGTANDGSTITATVTAWNATHNSSGQYVLSQAYLGNYAAGLGITSAGNDAVTGTLGCGAIGSCGTNQIDNMGSSSNSSSIDFLRISFSAPVVLGTITRSTASIADGTLLGHDVDNDFSYGSGAAITANQTVASLTGLLGTNVGAAGACGISIGGCNDSATLASANQATALAASQNWYVGASVGSNYGGDGVVDAFKVTNLTSYTQSPVPEPSTWAMMIIGFGGIGSLIRRHKTGVRHLLIN